MTHGTKILIDAILIGLGLIGILSVLVWAEGEFNKLKKGVSDLGYELEGAIRRAEIRIERTTQAEIRELRRELEVTDSSEGPQPPAVTDTRTTAAPYPEKLEADYRDALRRYFNDRGRSPDDPVAQQANLTQGIPQEGLGHSPNYLGDMGRYSANSATARSHYYYDLDASLRRNRGTSLVQALRDGYPRGNAAAQQNMQDGGYSVNGTLQQERADSRSQQPDEAYASVHDLL